MPLSPSRSLVILFALLAFFAVFAVGSGRFRLTAFAKAPAVEKAGPTSTEGPATTYSRMFAAGLGVLEDPATGSAAGPLGCYLVQHGCVSGDEGRQMVNVQGVKMGRASRIHISITGAPDAITDVKVGGEAVLVAQGEFLARLESAVSSGH